MENGTVKKSLQLQAIKREKLITLFAPSYNLTILHLYIYKLVHICLFENPKGDVKILLNFSKHLMSCHVNDKIWRRGGNSRWSLVRIDDSHLNITPTKPADYICYFVSQENIKSKDEENVPVILLTFHFDDNLIFHGRERERGSRVGQRILEELQGQSVQRYRKLSPG